MSTEIDWSKAPEGTTHARSDDSVRPWRKKGNGCWFAWCPERNDWIITINVLPEDKYVKREWYGEGLPPVGTVCEWRDHDAASWHKVEVRYLSKHTALLNFPGDGDGDTEGAFSPSCCEFRPLRTPEQIAAEEREKAVHQMGLDAGFSGSVQQFYERLYDLGYRKVNP